MRVIAYLDGEGKLFCAARCADRDFAELLGQAPVPLNACDPHDACDKCGTPVSTLAANIAGHTARAERRAARELVAA